MYNEKSNTLEETNTAERDSIKGWEIVITIDWRETKAERVLNFDFDRVPTFNSYERLFGC